MKQEQLQNLQAQVFSYFKTVLDQDRLAHAYLFSGAFASFDMAVFLSQAIFCQNKSGILPCGVCRTCCLIEQGEFSDVTILSPQGNTIKTERVRELVKDFSQSGYESNKQVFIICDAEKMHPNAANALLKVIEEPQSESWIFLLTNQEELVLPTIKSRTQIVRFPKNQEALEYFLEQEGLLRNQATLVAQIASSMEEAAYLAQNKSFLDVIAVIKKFVDRLLNRSDDAYLQVGQVVALLPEKGEQGRVFDLISLLLVDHLADRNVRKLLSNCAQAKKMWQANVSLQNALEYLCLQG